MEKTTAKEAMKKLTKLLPYLLRFTEIDRFSDENDFLWKGYYFDILNELDAEDSMHQIRYPSRSKSLYITESGT